MISLICGLEKRHELYKSLKKMDKWRSKYKKNDEHIKAHVLKKRRDSHLLKIKTRERSFLLKEYSISLSLSAHMHILIYKYDIFLLGSEFWLNNTCNASMPMYLPLPKLHIIFVEVGRKRAKLWYALVRNQTQTRVI